MHFDLQEEVQSLQDGSYAIDNELSVKTARPGQVDVALDGAIDAIAGSSESVNDAQVFDTFRSLLKHATHLEPVQLSKLLDALSSAFQAEIDATARDGLDLSDPTAYRSHRTTLEIYAFLLMWYVQAAERYINTARANEDGEQTGTTGKKKGGKGKSAKASKGKGDFAWSDHIQSVLLLFSKALRLKTERIWQTTQERDSFIGCFIKPTNRLAENETYMKSNDIRMAIYKVFCLAAKNHGQAFGIQVLIMQNLTAYEHLPEPMAELVTILVKEFDYAHLGEELLREIASKNFPGGADTRAQRPFPRFLVKLSELCPRLVHKQMVVLQTHLDSESYPMRNAIIEVLGNLIREVTNSEEEGEPGQQKRELENFFSLLFDRFLDINAFVRSKVVQVFLKILDIHTNRFADARLRLTALAVRSLEDKTSTVRKNCIALLVKLILTHPYGALHGGELDLTKFEEGYKRVCDELAPMEAPSQEVLDAMANDDVVPEDADKENEQNDQSAEGTTLRVKREPRNDGDDDDNEEALDTDEESSDEDETREERRAKAAAAKAAQKQRRQSNGGPRKSDVAIGAAFARLDQDKLTKLRLTKQYYADALTFIAELEKAVTLIETLLASKVKSEVLEAMEFFKVAYEYKLESAESGVKRMLHLVWSKDNSTVEDGQEIRSIRSRLIECYRSLYFDPLRNLAPVENVNRITKNMISLTFGATLAQLTSLEQLMITLMNEDAVHDDITAKLWQVYSASKDIPKHQRRGAILVLGMLAAAKPEMISEHIDLLLKIGLGPRGKADFVLAKYSCIALRRLGGNQKKVKGALSDTTVRLPMDNPVFERLKDIVEKTTDDQEWFSMAEQAINTIYVLGEQPDSLSASIIQDLTRRLFGDATAASGSNVPKKSATPEEILGDSTEETANDGLDVNAPARAEKEDTAEVDSTATDTETLPPSGPQMANAFQLAQLLYTAGHVSVRQLLHLELAEREFKRRKAELEKKDSAKAASTEELDQVVGSVEDDIADLVMHAKEKELLYSPEALLSIYGPMAVAICSQPKVYKNNTLRIAAVSAMCKFMCVSAQFCEDHLMLLFKILETATNPIIRSNIVIALGDIAVCFSTLMDQNSDRLYAGLTDRDLTVKKNTLMVLTHLILNGMIKVKGQLGEMAKCIEDDDDRISDLAKLFFEELSTKENAIYNNLPDIISHLSVGKHAVDEETYWKIMKYIFRYIEKEKQAESIIDKLCQRFRVVTDERQWRDIAFCMSMLPFKSERSVKRLVEGLPFYQDKLKEDTVYRLFTEILNKARSNKAVKNENELVEFERALEEHKRLGQENAAIEQKAQRKTKRRAAAAPRGRGKARVQQSSTPPSSPER